MIMGRGGNGEGKEGGGGKESHNESVSHERK